MTRTNERRTLAFGRGASNEKLKKLEKRTGRKVLTLSLSAGHACPYAVDCKASVKQREDGSLYVVDGPDQVYRCYAASMEARRPLIHESRQINFRLAREASRRGVAAVKRLILRSLPARCRDNGGDGYIVRAHVAGDYFNLTYLRGWMHAAASPELAQAVVYGHTKALPLLERALTATGRNAPPVVANMRFVLSRQDLPTVSQSLHEMDMADGICDIAAKLKIRCVQTFVLDSKATAKAARLPIDEDDYLAYKCKEDFALIVHGTQPKGKKHAAGKG